VNRRLHPAPGRGPGDQRHLRQRRLDALRERFAPQLDHAERLAAAHRCGDVVGVFGREAGGELRPGSVPIMLAPVLVGVVVLVALARNGTPGAVAVLTIWPFLGGLWIGLTAAVRRLPRRQVLLFAFGEGFMVLDGAASDPEPVRWWEVTSGARACTDDHGTSGGPGWARHTGYELRLADGSSRVVPRDFRNLLEPRVLAGPSVVADGRSAGAPGPVLPTIDDLLLPFVLDPNA